MGTRPVLFPRRARRGATAIEFAFAVSLFFVWIFATLEVARLMYLWNTLQQVTRHAARAAAVTDFSDTAGMDRVRQAAVLRQGPGQLTLGGPISDSYVKIDYLSLSASGVLTPVTSMPACPAQNIVNCINAPHGGGCIRFVRARLCTPDGGECSPVPYTPMVGLLGSGGLGGGFVFNLPVMSSVLPAESLGHRPGMSPTCP